ncbi:MAG TPA: NUDIX hydrolase [Candidatus Saccharimonadales bacterium]|nr:NUDIX hydrolase [Candidatus Saccharimonadales bacterium]
MVQWQRVGDTSETKSGWRIVTRKNYRFPNGKEFPFDVIGREGDASAAIIALTPDDQMILSEQYRPGPDMSMYELPGGFVDKGEDPKEAVVRELLEETGYKPARVVFLGNIHKEAYLHLKMHYYVGYDCVKVAEPQIEETEYIEVRKLHIGEFLEAAKRGETTDTPAAFLAYDLLRDIQKKAETKI